MCGDCLTSEPQKQLYHGSQKAHAREGGLESPYGKHYKMMGLLSNHVFNVLKHLAIAAEQYPTTPEHQPTTADLAPRKPRMCSIVFGSPYSALGPTWAAIAFDTGVPARVITSALPRIGSPSGRRAIRRAVGLGGTSGDTEYTVSYSIYV
ncbi:hypothetical protein Bbelb_289250 [Branchiostoma belcheri]|nr:hypothetical protein Bbelb_289250 [Branchiostoma belcheri]